MLSRLVGKRIDFRIILVVISIMIIASTAIACGDTETETERSVTIALGSDLLGWDIHGIAHTDSGIIHRNVFDSLGQIDEDGQVQPVLAKSWELIDDYTWRFFLHEGVLFHNGDEVTAEDVKWTLERVAHDDSLLNWRHFNQIKEVKIIDDYTVDIITHETEPVLLNRISRSGTQILPKAYIEAVGWDEFERNPVGTGAYRVVEWIRDDRVVLEAFEDYFLGESDVKHATFRVIPEDSSRVAEAITGGVDFAVNIPPEEWDRVEQEPGVELRQGLTNRVLQLEVKGHPGEPLSDPRLREALEYAIDSERINEVIYNGLGIPTRTTMPPGNFGANPDYHETSVYDPDHARDLLAQAGYDASNRPSITFNSGRGRYMKDSDTAEFITQMLEDVGFDVDLQFLEWSAFTDARGAGTHADIGLIGFATSMFDGEQRYGRLKCGMPDAERIYGFCCEETSRLIELAAHNMNREERLQQYQEIVSRMAELRMQIPFLQLPNVLAVAENIVYQPRLDEFIYLNELTFTD